MKKNTMMRIASVLLVVVLLTTSVISGTFAKYVTSGSASDSARVAKWGVTITANGATFAKEYNKDDIAFTEAKSVISNSEKVVAPGTDGSMVSMTLAGEPEVATRVSYVGVFDIENWTDQNGAYYCPIIITVEGTQYNGATYPSADEFEAAVNNAIKDYSKDYPAGTNLSGLGADSLEITWEWPFSTSAANDVRDTYLGDQAAAGNAATVQLTVTTTVTQID